MATPILSVRGLDKRFGPVAALASVDFALEAAEIHALLGVNGAGKSTFVKILSGVYLKDAGSIAINGAAVEFSGERDAISAGITSVQQHPELIGDLSGYENIFLGQETDKPGLFRRIDHPMMRRRAQSLLERFAIAIDLTAPVSSLQPVEKEIIAILHALYRSDMKVLILDEPTSTLTRVEKVKLFELMRSLKASGVAIIYIPHRLEEVFEVADRFTVFRAGRNVATFTAEEASRRQISIPRLMLEGELGDLYPPKRAQPPGEMLLEVASLTDAKAYHAVSFHLRRGEILGIFGLVGSGIDELAKTLFGVTKPISGEIRLKSKRVVLSGARDALRRGIFLVPGDRRAEGLVLTRNVTFNVTLANLGRASWFGGLLRFGRNRRLTADLAERIDLNPPHLWRIASKFSGGNQQKIVVAKGLFRQAETYIFVEPTIGVDIGARAKLYALIRELSKKAGVIVLSSDCDEVYGLSDRVMALYKGRVPADGGVPVTRDQLLSAGIMGAISSP
jgi:ABC-type sugar transport system ATPase subunit